ncbi:MAG: hypothetical protein QXM68_01300 [Candidatus Aenigmatarchaeota archaeon]|nr:hypothetical protein [Candidatus Aenigmarchaeota archaeon]
MKIECKSNEVRIYRVQGIFGNYTNISAPSEEGRRDYLVAECECLELTDGRYTIRNGQMEKLA